MSTVQTNRFLSIDTPAGSDVLLITSVSVTERISSLFQMHVGMIAVRDKASQVKVDDLIGKPMSIKMALGEDNNGPARYFHGICTRFSVGGRDPRFVYYNAELRPWTWLLTQKSNNRIFTDVKGPEVVTKIFDELKSKFSFVDYQDKTNAGKYTKLDYLVQFRETDFNLVSRVMEEEGIHFYFVFEEKKHTLVMADSSDAHEDCSSKVRYAPEGGWESRERDVIGMWRMDKELRPGEYVTRDYHFQMPGKSLEVSKPTTFNVGGNASLQMFDYPGAYAQRFNKPEERMDQVQKEGEKLVEWRMEDEESSHVEISGESNCRSFCTGANFELDKHFDGPQNRKYTLLAISHRATQDESYISGGEAASQTYMNDFTCIPHDIAYRPPRSTPKPVVEGVQSAVVVGKQGEEVWTDKYGRIRVQFHWDREEDKSQYGDQACWVRVAQAWAGKRWGSFFLPRVGQEVLIAFLNGDPDHPVCVGSVYNAEQMPAYIGDGPDSQHKHNPHLSGIKTNTTKGGDGYNELRFNDTKDKEQVFIHAERNMDTRVKNDSLSRIYGNRHQIIGWEKDGEKGGDQREMIYQDKQIDVKRHQLEHIEGNMKLLIGHGEADDGGNLDIVIEKNRKEKIEGDSDLLIGGNHKEKMGGNLHTTVDGNHHNKVGGNIAMEAGAINEIHLKAGMKVIIEAGMQLSLIGPGGFVDIGPAGVTIQGLMVKINSGGAAGMGSGCSPEEPAEAEKAEPTEPSMADDAVTGSKSAPD